MEKIQKIIANRGYTSRRKAEELIMQGKVYVDGKKASIGDRIDEVAKQLKKEAKGIPFIAVFTFGEYGVKDHGANTTGGLMLSFTAFAK